jgi:hypothetical protein
MMNRKTTAERQAELRQRRKAEGLERETIWLSDNDRAALKQRFPGPRSGIDWQAVIRAALDAPCNPAPALDGSNTIPIGEPDKPAPPIADTAPAPAEVPQPAGNKRVMCAGCANLRPKARRCDAGHTKLINFVSPRKKGVPKPYEPRHCEDYKPKAP